MGEISKAVGQWIVSNLGWAAVIFLFVLSGLFKIVKVEVNPIGWILDKIGNAINRGVNTQIDSLKKDLDDFEKKTNESIDELKTGTSQNCAELQKRLSEMEKSNDFQSARQIKAHVLEFANSCMTGQKHTLEDFTNLFEENEEYEKLVAKYELKNDVYTEDMKYIKKVYQHCMETNSFLQ